MHWQSSGGRAWAAALAVRPALARQATPPVAGLPRLEIALTDAGFELPETIMAGRHEAVVINTGTMTESHWAMGKFPDEVTEAEIEAFFAAQGEDTEALAFDDVAFVGVPDWPQPGGPAVTGREREILVLLAQGRSNAMIAQELSVSVKTVTNNVSVIFDKMQVANRAEAIVQAREAGLGA